MKKAIIISALLIASVATSFAQSKTDTTKKPDAPKREFKADPAKVYHIVLDLNEYQLESLIGTSDGVIHRHAKLSGEQIGMMEDEAKQITKAIQQQANDQLNADYKKWQADTVKKAGKK